MCSARFRFRSARFGRRSAQPNSDYSPGVTSWRLRTAHSYYVRWPDIRRSGTRGTGRTPRAARASACGPMPGRAASSAFETASKSRPVAMPARCRTASVRGERPSCSSSKASADSATVRRSKSVTWASCSRLSDSARSPLSSLRKDVASLRTARVPRGSGTGCRNHQAPRRACRSRGDRRADGSLRSAGRRAPKPAAAARRPTDRECMTTRR